MSRLRHRPRHILSGFPAPNNEDLIPLCLRHDSIPFVDSSVVILSFPHGAWIEQSVCDHRQAGSAATTDQWAFVVQRAAWPEMRRAARVALHPRDQPVL